MSAGASAAASAAAAARRRIQQEEEEMTTYSSQELAEGWEFKILRSVRGAFRDPARLKQVLAEEGRAGWILVEKFDDGRIRLKRPAGLRDFDGKLDFDPYRTCLGPSETKYALTLLGITMGVFALILGVVLVMANSARDDDRPVPQPTVDILTAPKNAPQMNKP